MKRFTGLLFLTMLLRTCDPNDWHPQPFVPPNQTHILKCAFGYPGEDCSDLKK